MGKKNLIYSALTRVAVLLPSVFCAFSGVAQTSLSERLNYVLEAQDMNMGLKLYNEITENDLKQLPDSVLFNYHYLGGYLNSAMCHDDNPDSPHLDVEPNHKISIEHLLEAQDLCEKSLGIHSVGYIEIMRGLGEEYLEIGEYNLALQAFQDGIVKAIYVRNIWPKAFGNLIIGVQECYERMGWYSEIPGHLYDAWSFWTKDDAPFTVNNYFPLWNLHQFYHRYAMYEKAIKVSDEIIDFITTTVGPTHPDLAEELYFRGNTFSDMGNFKDAIEAYRKSISILESNQLELNEEYCYNSVLGNLLLTLISTEKWDESKVIMNKIQRYGNKIGDEEIYNSILTAVAFTLCNNGFYDKALSVNTELLGRSLSNERKQTAESQREEILFSQEVIDAIPELEILLKNTSVASNEWFDIAFKLTSAYFRKKDSEKSIALLISMYQAITRNNSAKDEYYFSIVGALFNICLEKGDYDLALKYAIEKQEYISAIPDVPERFRFDCMNNIVVAKLKSNKLDGIFEDWSVAAQLCRNVFGEESEVYAIQLHNKGRALQLEHKYDDAKQHYLDAIALHTKVKGKPMPNTVQYLIETENQIVEHELDL